VHEDQSRRQQIEAFVAIDESMQGDKGEKRHLKGK
jgi:hypothetical protein